MSTATMMQSEPTMKQSKPARKLSPKAVAIGNANEKLSVLNGMSDEIGSKINLLRHRIQQRIEPEVNESALRGLESQMMVIETAVDAVESTMEACFA